MSDTGHMKRVMTEEGMEAERLRRELAELTDACLALQTRAGDVAVKVLSVSKVMEQMASVLSSLIDTNKTLLTLMTQLVDEVSVVQHPLRSK